MRILLGVILFAIFSADVLALPTVVPNVKQDTNVQYYDNATNKVKVEVFKAPVINRDFGPVEPLLASPIEAQRLIDNIPTFGLAKWHWWLFGTEMLNRAQRQYADCVGQIRFAQQLLGEKPLIDDPASPWYASINSIREYPQNFEPVQNFYAISRPPSIEEARAHAQAALTTYNIFVVNVNACRDTATGYLNKVKSKIRR